MSEPLLQMCGTVKTFGGIKALNGVNLVIRSGEYASLCDENGAGKSTLTKILSSVYPNGAWDDEILWEGQPLHASGVRGTERAGIVIIHQGLMLVSKLPVTENIYLGSEITLPGGRVNYAAMCRGVGKLLYDLNIQGINATLPMMHYDGGHQQLIKIVRALNRRAKLLVLDELSSSLTAAETRILLDIIRDLKARGIVHVYISHKLDEVEAVCDTVTVVRDGRHVATTPMGVLTTDCIITQVVGREIT